MRLGKTSKAHISIGSVLDSDHLNYRGGDRNLILKEM